MISPSEAIEKVSRVKGLYAYESDYEALDFAICAIEKQIPRKAVGNHSACMLCPNCKHTIPSGGSGRYIRRRESWCSYCGQKIDWS